jgi:hypothetical protein
MVVRPKRNLLLMFLATVLVLVAVLAWMASQLLRQDRALAGQRVRELCDATADIAVATLHKRLDSTEAQLAALLASPNATLSVEAAARK